MMKQSVLSGKVRLSPGKAAGFTLIELLVGIAISGVIVTGTVLVIYSIMVTMARGSNQTISLADINRAALAIKNDLLMAQTTGLTEGVPQSTANLSWVDNTSSFGSSFQTYHSATYSRTGRELRRTSENGSATIVGRNITSITFTQAGNMVTVVLSSSNATSASNAETITFSVHLRPEEVE